jgi:hypothetical protein
MGTAMHGMLHVAGLTALRSEGRGLRGGFVRHRRFRRHGRGRLNRSLGRREGARGTEAAGAELVARGAFGETHASGRGPNDRGAHAHAGRSGSEAVGVFFRGGRRRRLLGDGGRGRRRTDRHWRDGFPRRHGRFDFHRCRRRRDWVFEHRGGLGLPGEVILGVLRHGRRHGSGRCRRGGMGGRPRRRHDRRKSRCDRFGNRTGGFGPGTSTPPPSTGGTFGRPACGGRAARRGFGSGGLGGSRRWGSFAGFAPAATAAGAATAGLGFVAPPTGRTGTAGRTAVGGQGDSILLEIHRVPALGARKVRANNSTCQNVGSLLPGFHPALRHPKLPGSMRLSSYFAARQDRLCLLVYQFAAAGQTRLAAGVCPPILESLL